MIGLTIFLAAIASALAGYSGSNDGNQLGDGGHGQGGYGYGYSGSFSGSSGSGQQGFSGGVPPQFASQFDFLNFLNSYFDSLRKYNEQFHQNALSYSFASSDPSSKAKAKSSLKFRPKSLQTAQQGAQAGYGFPGGFPAFAGVGTPNRGGFQGFGQGFNVPSRGDGASASASIGQGGIHQSASVFPENPNNPNVNTRFGETPKGDGFYSVSTSSFSSSSNVDGKPSSFHQASTSVNDNGKVTSFTVHNP